MSWYQPGDFEISFPDADHPSGEPAAFLELRFSEKLKLFLWNFVMPTFLRRRLLGSRLHRWVIGF